MHEKHLDKLSLFPKWGDHNAKQKWKKKKHDNKEQGKPQHRITPCSTTKPHKIRIT